MAMAVTSQFCWNRAGVPLVGPVDHTLPLQTARVPLLSSPVTHPAHRTPYNLSMSSNKAQVWNTNPAHRTPYNVSMSLNKTHISKHKPHHRTFFNISKSMNEAGIKTRTPPTVQPSITNVKKNCALTTGWWIQQSIFTKYGMVEAI